jgi:hypothetical protein
MVTECSERFRIKLSVVINSDGFRDSEAANNALLEKSLDNSQSYCCQGFSFDSFGEVLYYHHCIFYISLCCSHWAYYIHSPSL